MYQVIRKFSLSCPEFGGFLTNLAVNDVDNLQDIVDAVIANLRKELVAMRLETLYKRLDEMKPHYHIHDFSVIDIIMHDRLYYVCLCGSQCDLH